MKTTATRRIEWDAAHRVLRHESKCATLHGHRYVADITCKADALDGVGRVIDFGVVKLLVGGWVDATWDHSTMLNEADAALGALVDAEHAAGKRAPYRFAGEPTAENIAAELYRKANELVAGTGVRVVHVRVYETPNCWADHG